MDVRLMKHSAGAAGNFLAPMDQISANAMKSVIDIDVLGSWNTVKATLPYLLESAKKYPTNGSTEPVNGTGGRIIFVSATLHYAGTPLQSHVSVAKAGVDAMAMSVAIEQGPRGITSNVIAPGPIADTEGMSRLSRSDNHKNNAKTVPSGRYGTVKEIADATVYLFSDSGNFVNGEVLVGKSSAFSSIRVSVLLMLSFHSRRRTLAHIRCASCWSIGIPRVSTFRRGSERCCRWEAVEAINL
jgi:peroxisomal 2,4-dienoyl-CoA reductase